MKINTKSVSFVIPCYRSENTIESVVLEIKDWVATYQIDKWEIILVNDCSPDNLQEHLERLANHDKNIKVIELAKNMGKHAAMLAGYNKATGDVVVNLDDDGQCPIDKLDLLLYEIDKGADIALAEYITKRQSLFKQFGSFVNEKMAQIMIDQAKGTHITNFSVIRKVIVEEIVRYKNPYPYVSGLMIRSTKHIVNVKMEERERISGESGYTLMKSLKLWLNGFTAFSVKPLRISSLVGMCCTGIGMLYGLYIIIHRLLNPAIPAGYSSLMAVLLFIGGMIMLMLGMIGEYVGRIYISINNSPQYVIRQTINLEDGKHQQELVEGRTERE